MTEFNMTEVLSNATKLNPKPRESAFNFSRRLIKQLAAEDFPADEWDTIPDDAQQWVNEQIRATNENKQVDEVPGFDDFVNASRFTSASHAPTKGNGSTKVEASETEDEDDEDSEEVVEEDEAVEDEDEEEKPAKVAKVAKVAKEKKEKAPKVKNENAFKKRTDGKPSAIVRMKELLIEDLTLSPNQLIERLEGEEYKLALSTVVACKADFKATISLLRSKGLVTGVLA